MDVLVPLELHVAGEAFFAMRTGDFAVVLVRGFVDNAGFRRAAVLAAELAAEPQVAVAEHALVRVQRDSFFALFVGFAGLLLYL